MASFWLLVFVVALGVLVPLTQQEAQPNKPRFIMVSGVKVDPLLYDAVRRVAERKAEQEMTIYLRLVERAVVVPDWKERIRVRVRTFAEARQLVAHFFAEYRRILQPHHLDLNEHEAAPIIRKVVSDMANSEFSKFARWFTKKYRHGMAVDERVPGRSKDRYDVQPGAGTNEPTAGLDKDNRGLSIFSNDPIRLDPRFEALSADQKQRINQMGGVPKDWAGRLRDPSGAGRLSPPDQASGLPGRAGTLDFRRKATRDPSIPVNSGIITDFTGTPQGDSNDASLSKAG